MVVQFIYSGTNLSCVRLPRSGSHRVLKYCLADRNESSTEREIFLNYNWWMRFILLCLCLFLCTAPPSFGCRKSPSVSCRPRPSWTPSPALWSPCRSQSGPAGSSGCRWSCRTPASCLVTYPWSPTAPPQCTATFLIWMGHTEKNKTKKTWWHVELLRN